MFNLTNILQMIILIVSGANVVISIITLKKVKELNNNKTKTEQVLSQFK